MFSYFFMVFFTISMQMKIWCKCKKPPSKSKRRFLHKYMYQNSLIFVMQLLQTRECSTSVNFASDSPHRLQTGRTSFFFIIIESSSTRISRLWFVLIPNVLLASCGKTILPSVFFRGLLNCSFIDKLQSLNYNYKNRCP